MKPDDDFAKELEQAFHDEDKSPAEEIPKETPEERESPETSEREGQAEETPQKDGGAGETPDESTEKIPQPGEVVTPQEQEDLPQNLTKDDIRSVISDLRNEERTSVKELDTTTEEVLNAYYPKGLSNTLVDEATGKEIRTPQDVVDLSGGQMSHEEAAQWLMNEQYKLDRQVSEIKENARQIAETTVNFKRDGQVVLEKYSKLFEAYPQVQEKVWKQYMKFVKVDEERGVVLQAPDMQDFYDTMLDPYRLAFEYKQNQPATNPTPPPTPEPAKPGLDDRLDELGDGGLSEDSDDPNDFAQQVVKELKKGY